MSVKSVRTRFAPSPTGSLHIGGARTALFEYLFARHAGGEFLLRIEDTDQARYDKSSVAAINDSLEWLSISPKNLKNPIIQSKRLPMYEKAALKLAEAGAAYVCDCSKERLAELRAKQTTAGQPPRYDGRCRARNLKFKKGLVIRQKIPTSGTTVFTDLIRGKVEFANAGLDDHVLLKSDGYPTYHLANVVDDHDMKITHIIRGEEWLPSTPKHILLYQAFGWEPPEFAHLPIILGPNRGKLSKRDGATGVLEYKKMGYLPEALINFVVLLGWNPKTEEEFFTLAELEEKFDISQVNKAAAVFNVEKLNFFNRHYLKLTPGVKLVSLLDKKVVAQLPEKNLDKIVDLAKERMTTLADFAPLVEYFINRPKLDKAKLVFRKSTPEVTKKALADSSKVLASLKTWNASEIKYGLEKLVASGGYTNGDVFWSCRYGLCGLEKSPPPEEMAEVLGQKETVSRLADAQKIL